MGIKVNKLGRILGLMECTWVGVGEGEAGKINAKRDHRYKGNHEGNETEGNWGRPLEINRSLVGSGE